MNEQFKIKLQEHIANKLVTVQKHPTAELFIYNYSPKVQYDKLWDEVTSQTRGLILYVNMNIVAKPFGKFFNIEELQQKDIPNLPFEVFEKMDGSLGILYWIDSKPFIATRGSFNSKQAIHATNLLYSKYSHTFDKIDKGSTYLFEIIYPDNRIVVDYGDLDDLILLTVIDNNTNAERIENIGFPIVKRYNGITDYNKLRELSENNKEGFVIRFSNGFRMKLKYSEYVRLHRIITGVSNIAIWEYLKEGLPFDDLLVKVPDEFYNWVKYTQKELTNKYNEILDECKSVYKILDTRKDTALYFQKQKYPSVLFALMDGRNLDEIIWKMIRPTFSKPFKVFDI